MRGNLIIRDEIAELVSNPPKAERNLAPSLLRLRLATSLATTTLLSLDLGKGKSMIKSLPTLSFDSKQL
ncbi:MAG: hypothetical protein AB1390_03330 [Nitrospirota bacterium]